jgi:hypothetical protein
MGQFILIYLTSPNDMACNSWATSLKKKKKSLDNKGSYNFIWEKQILTKYPQLSP